MGISFQHAERFARPASSGDRFIRAIVLACCMAAAPTSLHAFDDSLTGEWTVSLAPSLFAPRMNGLNNALASDGINVIQSGAAVVGLTRAVTGFKPIQWGAGGQIDFLYQLNDDLRGGLRLGFADVSTSDKFPISQVTSFTASCSGCPVPPSITNFYDVSEKIHLPLFTLGLSLQKVFLFEEEPNLRLYLGGSGMYSTLLGATIKGVARHFNFGNPLPLDDQSPYKAALTGQGWGFGGAAGGEYAFSPVWSIFLETGFDWLHIPNVQASLRVGPMTPSGGISSGNLTYGRLKNISGKPIEFDFSGVFIRLGVRINLNPQR